MPHQKIITILTIILIMTGSGYSHAEDTPAENQGPWSATLTFVTDYIFRGISQTNEGPALQAGINYKHNSGFYASFWGSTISWLHDLEAGTGKTSHSRIETDFSMGFTKKIEGIDLDVGLLQYYYPGHYSSAWQTATGLKKPHTLEAYASATWSFLNIKYSQTLTNLSGTSHSHGSQYLELNASYEIVPKITLNGHLARQTITGPTKSYNDWKLGAAYAWDNEISVELDFMNTNIKDNKHFNAGKHVVLSVNKTF